MNGYWNDWYMGWGWLVWFGILMLVFSSAGSWGYTYRLHRNFGSRPGRDALDILSERYASGEISRDDYAQMKSTISA